MGTNEDNYNVTILIAEDEESNFLLLKTILKRHCNVLQARTGLELLKVFAENDMEAARAAGSNGFITKPINIVELKKNDLQILAADNLVRS